MPLTHSLKVLDFTLEPGLYTLRIQVDPLLSKAPGACVKNL
jgi:hypothetical protein